MVLEEPTKNQTQFYNMLFVALALGVIGFSTIGVVVVRANVHPPVNMNAPTDPMRLVPYLNREQYGERPLLYGPHFDASPTSYNLDPRYGLVEDRYEIVDHKSSPEYRGSDKMLFPRMGHNDANRRRLYRNVWMNGKKGPPSMADNISFMIRYQFGWMYWRYFMWNFSGRQNGKQGYQPKSYFWSLDHRD